MTKHPLHPKLIDALSEYKTCPEAMRAAADWQLEEVVYAWEDAFQSDLEHGVRWLNDKAAKELATNYPKIYAFGEVLASMRPQEDN